MGAVVLVIGLKDRKGLRCRSAGVVRAFRSLDGRRRLRRAAARARWVFAFSIGDAGVSGRCGEGEEQRNQSEELHVGIRF